jgi:hypothetical protein
MSPKMELLNERTVVGVVFDGEVTGSVGPALEELALAERRPQCFGSIVLDAMAQCEVMAPCHDSDGVDLDRGDVGDGLVHGLPLGFIPDALPSKKGSTNITLIKFHKIHLDCGQL